MGMIEGKKQLAGAWGYSLAQTNRLLGWAMQHAKDVIEGLHHWAGPGHRFKATQEEALLVKKEIRKRKMACDESKRAEMSQDELK